MMHPEAFRRAAHEMVDYILSYHESLPERRPLANVEPGYLRHLIPDEAPQEPESWGQVMEDLERVIMPGVTHWHSPHFHAFLPTAMSYPSILADMLSDAIACIGFTWAASPACTELEMVMMDWLGKLIHLPEEFLFKSEGKGGGIIQGTASDATFVALLGARSRTIRREQERDPSLTPAEIMGKLVAYTSDQAHSSAERACLIGSVEVRLVQAEGEGMAWQGGSLERAVEEDLQKGKIPFFVVATIGTTNSMAFDDLVSLGKVCEKYSIWMHVDAAYAGSACICPEFRHLIDGVEYAESFNFNAHKWMMINFDCSAMWFKDASQMQDAFNVDPLYLKHQHQGGPVPDYRHWQVPLGRRFRSLKMWFVFRLIGATALQDHIRKQCGLAKDFEALVRSDNRFEIIQPATLGLTCFRLKGSNSVNETLVRRLNANGKIHLVPANLRGQFIVRFSVCGEKTTSADIRYAWQEICETGETILADETKGGSI